jgi:hypothetical protein
MVIRKFSEAGLVTVAAIACLISGILWVPWYHEGLSGSASTSLGYGLLWSPAYRAIAGASIGWSRVGAVLATTVMVWGILQLLLEPFSG